MMTQWWWISLGSMTFGLATREDVVVAAAPIARWCIGKEEEYVLRYWRKRGYEVIPIQPE